MLQTSPRPPAMRAVCFCHGVGLETSTHPGGSLIWFFVEEGWGLAQGNTFIIEWSNHILT